MREPEIFFSLCNLFYFAPIYIQMTSAEYNECVHLWSDALYRFALKSLSHQEDAQDAVQQAFEVLWRERDKVQREKGKSYLFTIVYRRCMDKHRYRKKIEIPEKIENNSSVSPYQNYEWKEYLQKALNKLDEKSRGLILLKDLEGYKYEEIAQLTSMSLEQVKVYLHRARKKLKDLVTVSVNPKPI